VKRTKAKLGLKGEEEGVSVEGRLSQEVIRGGEVSNQNGKNKNRFYKGQGGGRKKLCERERGTHCWTVVAMGERGDERDPVLRGCELARQKKER